MNNYDDIINLPHYKSKSRKPMSAHDRAAQFAPFAALTGYDMLVDEAARYTERKAELSEDEKAEIDLKLQYVREHIKDHPTLTVTYFVPDEYKQGGMYLTATGTVQKFNDLTGTITIDNVLISFDDIAELF